MNTHKNPNTGKKTIIKNDAISTLNKKVNKLNQNKTWRQTPIKKRIQIIKNIATLLKKNQDKMSHLIATETGKPLWECKMEINAAVNKSEATITAFNLRCNYPSFETNHKKVNTFIKPIGCVGIIGPYNFPIHIPHGQILPALLTGNTVLMKSSEYCTKTTRFYEKVWKECLDGIESPLQFIYGNHIIGKKIVTHNHIHFIYFTGSYQTGRQIEMSCHELRKPAALELGGNNALIIEDKTPHIIQHLIASSFITAGQRCSCARRIIINKTHEALINAFISATKQINIDRYPCKKTPFMGPVMLETIKHRLLTDSFKRSQTLLASTELGKGNLISPRIELSNHPPDEELFGPITFISLTNSFEESIELANKGNYGLTASIYTKSKRNFEYARSIIDTGIINWNNPTTGASGLAPFGGVKQSGNHRPGGFNMIDHCIIPVGSTTSRTSSQLNFPGL